jgi:flagellar protein FliO/FliZ
MDAFTALRAIAALVLVVGLMLGLAWGLRRFGARIGMASARDSDLKVLEWRTLDVRRKLAVVRWDGREHLLCLGPAGDLVVAHRDVPPPASGPAPATAGEQR